MGCAALGTFGSATQYNKALKIIIKYTSIYGGCAPDDFTGEKNIGCARRRFQGRPEMPLGNLRRAKSMSFLRFIKKYKKTKRSGRSLTVSFRPSDLARVSRTILGNGAGRLVAPGPARRRKPSCGPGPCPVCSFRAFRRAAGAFFVDFHDFCPFPNFSPETLDFRHEK